MFYWFLREKVLTSLLKSADVSKIMTSYLIFLCHLKYFRSLYNRGKFQVSSIKNRNFRGGGAESSPPLPGCGRSKKPGLGRVNARVYANQMIFFLALYQRTIKLNNSLPDHITFNDHGHFRKWVKHHCILCMRVYCT